MRLISDGKFEELKSEYHVEFEIKENKIHFAISESDASFVIEWASNFMYIANFIKQSDGREISYFISTAEGENSELIYMEFDNEMKLNDIFVGDA